MPDDKDIVRLSKSTFDIDEYIVDIAKKPGLAAGMQPIAGGVSLHLACHARAQNMGAKGAEMLRLIPEVKLDVIERCSGHGGTFGVMKKTRPSAMKIGKPVAATARSQANAFVVSECPLAAKHLIQVMEDIDGEAKIPEQAHHPIELMARAYGLTT